MIHNPYYDIWKANYDIPTLREAVKNKLNMEGYMAWSMQCSIAREELRKKYSYAIPSPEVLEKIKEFVDAKHVLEIGAGSGYWGYVLSQMGVNIECVDIEPGEMWYPVSKVDGLEILKRTSTSWDTVFLCWPDGEICTEVMNLMEEKNVKRMIYIGELAGGCTSWDNRLTSGEIIDMPNWQHVHDKLILWEVSS